MPIVLAFIHSFLLFSVLGLGLAPSVPGQAAACDLCADLHHVPCPPCAGKGTLRAECHACVRGKSPCPSCAARAMEATRTRTRTKSGFIPCPNPACDKTGRVSIVEGSVARCQVCAAKGSLPCPDCKGKDQVVCALCEGRRHRQAPCLDCVGTGRLPCPSCTIQPGAKCPLCQDTGLRGCGSCKGEPEGAPACGLCQAQGDRACSNCSGQGRAACDVCRGTGTMRKTDPRTGESRGTGRCDVCRGRGVEACGHCKKGRVPCPGCEKGKVAGTCEGCVLDGSAFCSNCLSGGVRLPELAAGILLQHGRKEKADAWISSALERVPRLNSRAPYQSRLSSHPRRALAELRFRDALRACWPPAAAEGGPKGPNELLEEHRDATSTRLQALRGKKKDKTDG